MLTAAQERRKKKKRRMNVQEPPKRLTASAIRCPNVSRSSISSLGLRIWSLESISSAARSLCATTLRKWRAAAGCSSIMREMAAAGTATSRAPPRGARRGVARLLVEEAELAEEGSGGEGGEHDLLSLRGKHDVHGPLFHDVEPVGRVSMMEDRLSGLEQHALGGALERLELLLRQVAKEMHPAETVRIRHESLLPDVKKLRLL